MIKKLSLWLQLVMVMALFGLGVVLWSQRDQVGDVVASVISSSNVDKINKRKRRGGTRGVPVIVAHVGITKNEVIITAVGTARARRSVMLHTKSDGIIVALNPHAGGWVHRGDTIFELDSTKAKLAVELAAKKEQEARRMLQRSQLLKRRKINSNAKVIDAKDVAERARLELLQAQETLSDLKITAPFDGVVGMPKAEIGDRVTAATPIVSLDMRKELLVEFEVPERYSARIKSGSKITAVTPSHQQTRFSGKIEYIDSRIDPTSRTMTVRALIPNEKDILRPGMSFVVELLLSGKKYTSVPELSLQWRKGESYVWIVANKKAKKTLVTAVRRLNSVVLVAGDIKAGDLVVVEGVQRLRPGRTVIYKAPKKNTPADSKNKRSVKINLGHKTREQQ